MLNVLFIKNPNLKGSTPTDLHHPDLHLTQFFSLESHKISSAFAETSLGLRMGQIFLTISKVTRGVVVALRISIRKITH